MATPLGHTNGNSTHARLARQDELEALFARAIPLRRHLEIYLHACERKMLLALQIGNGDMWTRGYYAALELREQIAVLDEETGRTS